MQKEFIKETKIIEKTEMEKEEELIKNIIRTKKDLSISRKNFEYAQSEDLIDYYIYEIKANQSKLDYLIKLAKTKGIIVDIVSDVKYKILEENNEAV